MSTALNDPRILRGMETQLQRRQERLNAGEQPLGWKIGFGAPAAMAHLGTDAPLIGFLTDKTRLPSAATVAITGWTKPTAEPEIAVYLGRDLAAGSDRETARAAIASIGPAIEVVDINFPPDDVEAILAGNIFHRHVILGRADASRAGGELEGLAGYLYRHETEIATTTDPQAMTGDLVDNVRHVANLLTALGERLQAGQVIITGSIVPPVGLAGEEEIRFTLDPVGTVSTNFNA